MKEKILIEQFKGSGDIDNSAIIDQSQMRQKVYVQFNVPEGIKAYFRGHGFIIPKGGRIEISAL